MRYAERLDPPDPPQYPGHDTHTFRIERDTDGSGDFTDIEVTADVEEGHVCATATDAAGNAYDLTDDEREQHSADYVEQLEEAANDCE
jgi:hypothetical protein